VKDRTRDGESGQAAVEWIGLLLVVSLLLIAVVSAIRGRVPGASLVEGVMTKLLCVTALSDACGQDRALVAAYGPDLAGLLEDSAPQVRYEQGMTALPVDYRSCRDAACGNGASTGGVWRSASGEPTVAFVHVVDCRASPLDPQAEGFDCSGPRAGNVYLQYWLYYENSTSLRDLPGDVGFHEDDWESYQVRITPHGTDARASSHHGYDYRGGAANWLSDAGIVHRDAWGPATGHTYVSGGSHAGHVYEPRAISLARVGRSARVVSRTARAGVSGRRPPRHAHLPRRLTAAPQYSRWTPSDRLMLIPIESLSRSERRTRFAVTPPWRKAVYRDPEDEGTS